MSWGKSFCQGCSLWALGDAWVELAVCLHVSTPSSSVTSQKSDTCSSLQPLGQLGKRQCLGVTSSAGQNPVFVFPSCVLRWIYVYEPHCYCQISDGSMFQKIYFSCSK